MAVAGYPFRRRIYAFAGTVFCASPRQPVGDDDRTAYFSHRSAIDPFAISALGLTGPGAPDTARVLALAALEDHADNALLVLPRCTAMSLFGLSEDELLDESAAGLFIPGNLDAALAYLETELAIRQGGGTAPARRLLLVADCEKEAERIRTLVAQRPGDLSAVLLGDWPAEQATVTEDGVIALPPAFAHLLPQHFPAMSRSEARDRLRTAIKVQRPMKTAYPRRSSRR
ncbi:hypothetical protein [Actinomadura rudentiformis]|uniref:Uncharacterized protein n=1 Tax=Actinomadura rudentiformis TaxID=359158 RepID=A0A6H9YPD1_9ACTN|nr:hypothetical protein [Actinomadura rudentiformis]KAB2346816.1 hypothetical protein F8566_21560 [Actinomadura rudentiformis]